MSTSAKTDILAPSHLVNDPGVGMYSDSSTMYDSSTILPSFQENPELAVPLFIDKKENLTKRSSLKTIQMNSPSNSQNRVRWSSPISSIKIIPAKEDLLEHLLSKNTSNSETTINNIVDSSSSRSTVKLLTQPLEKPSKLPPKFNISPTAISITKQDGPNPIEDLDYINITSAVSPLSRPQHSIPAFIRRPVIKPVNEFTTRVNLAPLTKALLPNGQPQTGSAFSHQSSISSKPTLVPNHVPNWTRYKLSLPGLPTSSTPDIVTSPNSQHLPHLNPSSVNNASPRTSALDPGPTYLPEANGQNCSSPTKRKAQIYEANPRPKKVSKVHVTKQEQEGVISRPPHSLNNLQANAHTSAAYVVDDDDYDMLNGEDDSVEEPPPSDAETVDSSVDDDDSDDGESDIDSLFDGSPPGINDLDSEPEETPSIRDYPTCATLPTQDVGLAASGGTDRAPQPQQESAFVDALRVRRWTEHLNGLIRLRAAGSLHAKHADNLYQHLQQINSHKGDPYLTPAVLKDAGLGMLLKQFRHGQFEKRSRLVADEITKYWRQMCREASS